MMKKVLFLCLIALASLTACAREVDPSPMPTLDATVLNQTAVSLATADSAKTMTHLPPTQTLAVATWTPVPTLDRTRPPIQTPTPEVPCHQAGAGSPIDVTIPDGTVMAPGEAFSKTWRLENVGSCEWTRLYTVTFFSGNSMNAFQTKNLAQGVKPGVVIDIAVDFEAPLKPGVYQSNWMLADPEGNLFGIGPNGDAPFWVRIEVVAVLTPTPTPTGTTTITPTLDAAVNSGD
jgi:hypothetical protein